MNPTATGHHVQQDGLDTLVLRRTFRTGPDDLWAAVTAPDRLVRWIGTWTGDPSTGRVRFRMTAEGADAPEDDLEIRECTPPTRLVVHSEDASGVWDIWLDLAASEPDGTVTLTFTHVVHDVSSVETIGPGWDYYLDRLVAAQAGADVDAVDFDSYYPALSAHYAALAAHMTTPTGRGVAGR